VVWVNQRRGRGWVQKKIKDASKGQGNQISTSHINQMGLKLSKKNECFSYEEAEGKSSGPRSTRAKKPDTGRNYLLGSPAGRDGA